MPFPARLALPLTLALLVLFFTPDGRSSDPTDRPENWAVKINRPGLPNLFKINDSLYRGAQPTAEGVKELQKLGVRTIVNLRTSKSDRSLLGETGIAVEAIPALPWDIEDEQVVRFLKIVTDCEKLPVFVHCQHGADRTGTMCAAYRVVVDGWTKQQALDEMTKGGFGFHSVWFNLPKFIENLDVQAIRAEVGLTE